MFLQQIIHQGEIQQAGVPPTHKDNHKSTEAKGSKRTQKVYQTHHCVIHTRTYHNLYDAVKTLRINLCMIMNL